MSPYIFGSSLDNAANDLFANEIINSLLNDIVKNNKNFKRSVDM